MPTAQTASPDARPDSRPEVVYNFAEDAPDALELAATDGSARFSQTLYTFDRLPDDEPWRAIEPPAMEAARVLPAKPLKKLITTLTPHIGSKQPIGIAMPSERHSVSFFMPDLTITIQALDGKPVQEQVEYFTQAGETSPTPRLDTLAGDRANRRDQRRAQATD